MTEMTKDILERRGIPAAPVYTLAECIAAASRHVTTDPNSEEEIQLRFRTSICLCNESELVFLRQVADRSEQRAAWEDEISFHNALTFCNSGMVYLFCEDEQCWAVLPDELSAIFREVTADEVFPALNAQKRELSSYAAALMNLYGIYEAEQFAAVWNSHHSVKITEAQAQGLLDERSDFSADFYMIDEFAVHDCLFEDDFDGLLDEVEDLDYFMPPKSVVREYATKGYDGKKIPGQQAMEDFLARYVGDEGDLEMTQFEIRDACTRMKSPDEVWKILEDVEMPLDDPAFRAEFERLYNRLRDHTHIWELRGHTPDQFRAATGKSIPNFRLPPENRRKDKRKG